MTTEARGLELLAQWKNLVFMVFHSPNAGFQTLRKLFEEVIKPLEGV